MSVKVVKTSPPAGNEVSVSGSVVGALIDQVRAHGGPAAVCQTLAIAGERRTFADLGDSAAWSSLTEAVALFDAAALVTAEAAVGVRVGRALLDPPGDEYVAAVLAAGSTRAVLEQFDALLRHFDRTSDAVLVESATDHALVKVLPVAGPVRHAHLCEMTRGILTRLPALFGSGPALVTESECSARGGRYCLYALSWDDPGQVVTGVGSGVASSGRAEARAVPDPTDGPGSAGPGTSPERSGERAERSGDEVGRMRTLMEGAFATSLELLDGDAGALLSEIARRADTLVTARRYLLMVQVRPGTPVKLHHRGLDEEEARALAAELWPGHPDDDGGRRLVVDIASGRHRYGRLVELVEDGAPDTPSEARLVRLYADYAATALDVHGVLDEARRSNATARSLLSFAEQLSRVTTPADLVQLLADTVPDVAGCERATVYLWEVASGQLVPRARSAGRQPPEAYLGPIVPLDLPRPGREPGDASPGATGVRIGAPLLDQLVHRREVVVIDATCDDGVLAGLFARSATAASVVAPLFAAGKFLGVVSASYGDGTAPEATRDPDLHERLAGLADQAATALANLGLLEKVSHMAWHDALTGLPNRRLFEDRVEQELVRSRRVGEPVCMFFVDIDYFKRVNDTRGHAAGDDLIVQVGRRLVDTVRRQDTVARVGGDEFAILLPGLADQRDIDELAERTLESLGAPFSVRGEEVEVSASIGVAVAPEHGDTYDELLNRADEAMYRAKSLGRNCFEMFSGPSAARGGRAPALDPASLQDDLAGALERGELFVLFQPYIDLHTSEVVGVEALVRWRHPTLGVLEPPSFIAAAERSDLIVDLDAWVLGEACREARAWFDSGLGPFRLAVNLATRDLADPGLSDTVERTLAETGIDPSLLDLEITERVVVDRWGPAKENIERLRRLGVRFTIDDFGAANSSLERIGSIPVSTLKINRSFVQVLGPDEEDDSLVSAIISMADRLGLDCVAEGVETSQQSRVLLQRGCSTAQGYYFSPPLAPADIGRLLATLGSGDGRAPNGDGG